MKLEALPNEAPNNGCKAETGCRRNTILLAITRFTLRCAIAFLSMCEGKPQPTAEEPEVTNETRMAYASFDQQVDCQCTSCKCELIVTAFRLSRLWPNHNGRISDVMRDFYAVSEPFTSTEIQLLDTHDEDYIRSHYPALAPRIKTEIALRNAYNPQLSGRTDGRPRGLFCTTATRH
jgi:hypothetical protein